MRAEDRHERIRLLLASSPRSADDECIVVGRHRRVAGIVEAEASMVDILMAYAAL